MPNTNVSYGQSTLPGTIRSRFVENVNGLTTHVLEAGYDGDKPCVLLLHGFPELAFSWRKIISPLAEAGYHVVAPDLRGYGRTTGWDDRFDGDLDSFRMLNRVLDALSLVYASGHRSVAAVVGHDYGSAVAGHCALIRPDVFRSVVLMSAPFPGISPLPFNTANETARPTESAPSMDESLAALARPRKHYFSFYSTREASADMQAAPQGIHDFLRAYYHHKSADWPGNQPHPLASRSADEFAKMPTYYIMDRDKGMAETVAEVMPSPEQIENCTWLTDEELRVYSDEFSRTGFQGGLQSYRCSGDRRYSSEMRVFSGMKISVPSCFIGGASDWGVYQNPGGLERMRDEVCTDMRGVHLVDGAGHWVQQEQPEMLLGILHNFLDEIRKKR